MSVNGVCRHLCGDQHLIKAIGGALRRDDPACRWGGDEFFCRIRVPSPEGALTMAGELRGKPLDCAFSALTGTAGIGAASL